MARRRTQQQILVDLTAADDGLVSREIKAHSLKKLAFLRLYFEQFAQACKRAQGGYYVDGLAGPGLCKVIGTRPPLFVWGSPLLALRSNPSFKKCILVEKESTIAQALAKRCEPWGSRAIVRPGDVNSDLARLIRQEVPGRMPCLCLLDPEGLELHWETIRKIASLPGRSRKPELLILFALEMSILRLLWLAKPMSPSNIRGLDMLFGDHSWWEVYQARRRGETPASIAKTMYLEIYENKLRKLGYRVQSKLIVAGRRGSVGRRELYHLIFATAHDAGEKIMTSVFDRALILDPISGQMPLDL